MMVVDVTPIEHEIPSLAARLTELSATMVELESHPGLQHVHRYPPAGVTAQRWARVAAALGQLWDEVSCAMSVLESPTPNALSERVDRMQRTLPAVVAFLDAVDEVNTRVARGIAPILTRLDAAGVAPLAALTDLLAASATDPLSFTADEVDRRVAELTELAELQMDWAQALAATADRLDAMTAARQRLAQIRALAERTVLTASTPPATDNEPGLRAELQAVTDAVALQDLRGRIDSALRRLARDEEICQGLLDRRVELKGRLRAYEAKAARLGLAEDPDLMSSQRIAAGLLSRRPCDLGAVTRAVADYQALLTEKRGRT